MPDRTQDLKNLRAVATACKNYTDSKIEDLRWELGTYELGVETVNGTTMLLPTPANTIEATVSQIDGASEKSENLAYIKDRSQTHSGISYVASETEQTLTLNETSSDASYQNFEMNIIPSGTYYVTTLISGTVSTACNLYLMDESNIGTAIGKTDAPLTNQQITFTNNQKYLRINVVQAGIVFNNLTIRIMVSKTSITEYKKGFTGIHNLELTGLKVEGSNILGITDVAETTINEITYSVNNGKITLKGTANNYTQIFIPLITSISSGTFSYNQFNKVSNYGVYLTDDTSQTHIKNLLTVGSSTSSATNIETSFVANYLYIYVPVNSTVNEHIFTPMLVSGSTAPTEYQPYITPTTKTIDLSSILYNGSPLFDGNSLKAVGTAKDYITPYVAHKQMIVIPFTSLNWNESAPAQHNFRGNLDNYVGTIIIPNATSMPNAITGRYNAMTWNAISLNSNLYFAVGVRSTQTTVITIIDNDYSTTEAFLQANQNEYLCIELATPIEVDIDLSQLVKFEAHSNGSITLVNTNNQDTTSTFKYLKEVAK